MAEATWAPSARTVTAKLMVINCDHALLMRAHGQHVLVTGSTPSVLKPIESTHANMIEHTVVDQRSTDTWTESAFERGVRLSIADNHPSNFLSDLSISFKSIKEILLRWIFFLLSAQSCRTTRVHFPIRFERHHGCNDADAYGWWLPVMEEGRQGLAQGQARHPPLGGASWARR